ncbi:MAG: hypothetical protein Q7U57_13905 [Methylovulum sp.]|nr:hypothetical protein [Methylovulum sp.]
MKIHSSSLTFSPARLNQQLISKSNNTQQNEKTELPAGKENQSLLRAYPANKVLNISEAAGSNFDSANPNNAYIPTDKRTLNALNAYHQELNQSLQAQRTPFITGVDTYA